MEILKLYCDTPGCEYSEKRGSFPSTYQAMKLRDATARARKDGWFIGRNRELCPTCSGKLAVKQKKPRGRPRKECAECKRLHEWIAKIGDLVMGDSELLLDSWGAMQDSITRGETVGEYER